MEFDLKAYLERVGLAGISPGRDGLRQLQGAQMRAIAFENIAPLTGEVPDLAPDAIRRKLVAAGRGGYCFELNGLLGSAMEAAGYAPVAVMGRVRMGAASGGPRSHLAWVVPADGREWLVDAGFGGPGPNEPLEIVEGKVQEAAAVRFRLRHDPANGELVVEREAGDGWFPLYGFDRVPVTAPDIDAANFLCSRWDRSPFPANLMMNIVRPDGRASLFNAAARVEEAGGTREWLLASAEELRTVMADLFGLSCDHALAAAVWRRIAPDAARGAAA